MHSFPYIAGKRAALTKLGVEESGVSLPQGVAMGAAGLAPFAGLIGQKPIIHDPLLGAKGREFKNMQELARQARAGDVLLTSKPKGSIWKNTITPIGGSEFYHAQPVIHRRGGMGTTISAGELGLDPGASLSDAKGAIDDIPKEMRAQGYSDVVLLRPKNVDAAARKEITNKSIGRVSKNYDATKAISTWLKEIFYPKLDMLAKRGPQTVCEGNVCSTVPAQALHETTGQRVVPGKKPQDIFPTDFLRSDQYELVGSKINPESYNINPLLRRARPYLARGAIGAGLAGTAGVLTEAPELAGVIPGGVAGSMGATALAKKLAPTKSLSQVMPSTFETAEALMADPKYYAKDIKRYLTRRLPLIAAGAGLGGLAGHGVKHLLTRNKTPE